MTRSVQVPDNESDSRQHGRPPGLTVHVAWWDESAVGEGGRYAMLTIDKGVVTDIYRRDLSDFINRAYLKPFDLDDASKELLRHPVVFESPEHDTVDIVFGDLNIEHDPSPHAQAGARHARAHPDRHPRHELPDAEAPHDQ